MAGPVERADAGSSRDDAAPRRDSGVTFVEIVVTIVLVGVTVLPILAAVRSSIRASSIAESAAVVETLLVNAVDRVNRADVTDCDYSGEVEAAVETYGWPASAASVRHEYLQADGGWSDERGELACEQQVRLITITVSHPQEDLTRTLEVVKGGV